MQPFNFNVMRLPFPVKWDELFQRTAPLVVEIGFGDGKFLVEMATHHPEFNFVGIERAHAPMSWTEKRVQREGLGNIRLLYGEAFLALRCLFEPETVQTFHLNFSDPWHKRRHHERRLIDAEFLETLVSRMVAPGGELHMATDIMNYAEQIQAALNQTHGLANAYTVPWLPERENKTIITRYEGRAIEEGRPRAYFKYHRTTVPVIHPPVMQLEENPMPNATMYVPLDLDTILPQFDLGVIRDEERIVSFKGVYRSTDRTSAMIETIIQEPLFNQRVMMLINEKETHHYLIRMAEIGYPRATEGVHHAVYSLVQWMLRLHPEARLIQHKVKLSNL